MKLYNDDNNNVLDNMEENSIGSIVTDPPYGISFMNNRWDYDVPSVDFWKKCLRVLKPGGYMLVFCSGRTQHRMAVNIEDAGFEIRDLMMWLYGQGYPKSFNIGKHLEEWEGWGTALKPALECITLARKPMSERTIIENIKKWGVGGINIGESLIPLQEGEVVPVNVLEEWSGFGQISKPLYKQKLNTKGRFPSNVLLDPEAARILNAQDKRSDGVARFFYNSKPSLKEKDYGLESFPDVQTGTGALRDSGRGKVSKNHHPTIKPIELMKYLVKLVTPIKEICLDPFLGSGTTMIACKQLGIEGIGIEKERDYFRISEARIEAN